MESKLQEIPELQISLLQNDHGTARLYCTKGTSRWSTIESCRRAGRIYCHAIKFWKQKDCSYEFWINKQHYCSLEIMQFRDLVLPSFCSSEKPDNWQFRYQALIFFGNKRIAVTSFGSLDTTCSCRICSSKILEVPMDNHLFIPFQIISNAVPMQPCCFPINNKNSTCNNSTS